MNARMKYFAITQMATTGLFIAAMGLHFTGIIAVPLWQLIGLTSLVLLVMPSTEMFMLMGLRDEDTD